MQPVRTLSRVAVVALASALLIPATAVGQRPGTNGPYLELIHPQSDDQGHYVRVSHLTRATIFGVVAPAEAVAEVSVNGRKARLFPAQMVPFGAADDADAVEFRATVEIRPETAIKLTVRGTAGATSHRDLEPDTDATVSRLRELVAAHPDDARSHCRLGNALQDENRLQEATEEFRAALERKSDCAYMRIELGRALLALGHPDEAIEQFTMATEIEPEDAMGWLNLGLVHARYTQNTDEAARCFRRYIELEPSSSIADKIRRYLDRVSP